MPILTVGINIPVKRRVLRAAAAVIVDPRSIENVTNGRLYWRCRNKG